MPEVTVRRKRPVTVRTLEWTDNNLAEMRAFCGDAFRLVYDQPGGRRIGAEVWDKLHTTWITVYIGNHIAQGVRGEFYPIDAAVLEETYEPAEPDTDELLRRSEEDGAITRLLDAETGQGQQ